ncbi:MAG: Asp-tRNA(Asn)/Glu-tRNA(Gln) amidotransferase subunit GatC [Spirochaetota bacterium]
MKIDSSVINRVSELARLDLSENEKEEFSRQLSDIIEYVEKINQLDTSSVEPADHIVPLANVFREDRAHESLPREALEKIAPRFENGHVVVPRIIEETE